MKFFSLAGVNASRVAQGCMRIGGMSAEDIDRLIRHDLDLGINFFDHADIYGGGSCETKFGDFLRANPAMRDRMVIQSKCGIKPGSYDFSKEHILRQAEQSLSRLGTDHLDFLLLHRPDTLVEPEEVAEAFYQLSKAGKVLHFGVSNHNPMQMELLNRSLGENKITVDQLQFSMAFTTMIDAGINVNMENGAAVNRDDSVLDWCRLNGVTIQPWSPFQHGFFAGPFIGNPDYAKLNEKLDEISARYDVTPTGMAIAWILRHPAKMQPIVGTTNLDRISQIAAASDVTITHDEWYELYR
ncbi:MAG: aldo/keto reductase, partial [Clostridia bacterium]|nr:aldo/keto reductase [Clostridia bacterium]